MLMHNVPDHKFDPNIAKDKYDELLQISARRLEFSFNQRTSELYWDLLLFLVNLITVCSRAVGGRGGSRVRARGVHLWVRWGGHQAAWDDNATPEAWVAAS